VDVSIGIIFCIGPTRFWRKIWTVHPFILPN